MKKKETIEKVKTSTLASVDANTGEILDIKTQTVETTKNIFLPREPDYVKVYVDNLLRMYDAEHGKSDDCTISTLMLEFLRLLGYTDKTLNIITLPYDFANDFCDKYNVSKSTYKRLLGQMLKNNYVKRVKKCKYMINPYFAGRGPWRDIERLQAQYDYMSGDVITEKVVNENGSLGTYTYTNKEVEDNEKGN